MKRVKFNVTTSVHMIPDEVYPDLCASLKKMKYEKFSDYRERIAAGSEFEMTSVNIGDVLDVPNWYYNVHKDYECSQGISFDKYTDKAGNRIPFDTAEAVKHGDMDDPKEMMKVVRKFDLVEDLDTKGRKSA